MQTFVGYDRKKAFQHGMRLFSSSGMKESESPSTGRRGGGLFIGLGWALLGLLAIDQILQYRQEQEAQEHRRVLYRMQEEANQQNVAPWDSTLPTLFQCRIIHKEPSLDGTKMLRNIGVGDVVEVLEAGVGPNQAYHLCRRKDVTNRPGAVGWYPIQYLEQVIE